MSILVTCECGKKYRVKDALAGKRIRCPSCEAAITVPKDTEPIPAPEGAHLLAEALEGDSQATSAKTRRCMSCGAPVALDAESCESCGAILQWTKTSLTEGGPQAQARISTARHGGMVGETCFFCKERPAEAKEACLRSMHFILNVERRITGKTVTYLKEEVQVPRCRRCATWHRRYRGATLIGGLAGFVSGAILGLIMAGSRQDRSFHWGVWVAAAVATGVLVTPLGALAGYLGTRPFMPGDIRPFRYSKEFHRYRELRSRGWKWGGEPAVSSTHRETAIECDDELAALMFPDKLRQARGR